MAAAFWAPEWPLMLMIPSPTANGTPTMPADRGGNLRAAMKTTALTGNSDAARGWSAASVRPAAPAQRRMTIWSTWPANCSC